jgi:hypothetical protein
MHDPVLFKWHHFEADIILWAVQWYLRYALSYRDVEELLRERGVWVDHTTVFRWVQHYAPELDKRCRPHLNSTNDSYRASTERHDIASVAALRQAEIDRRNAVLASAPVEDPFVRTLVAAADQYIVARGARRLRFDHRAQLLPAQEVRCALVARCHHADLRRGDGVASLWEWR